jgi:hypothetical protein
MNQKNLVLLKSVSDSDLLDQIRKNAAAERAAGLSVVYELREIRARRLDIRLGYPSLHRFCMEELKYSSGSAWRRIKAMEALGDLPELESKISEGELTLASVSQVQAFCTQQEKSLSEKKAILDQVAGLSKRETEKVLATLAPLPERPEKVREIDAAKTELRVTLSVETIEQLDRIRGFVSHALSPQASYAEVIEYLARLGVKRLDPGREVRTRGGGQAKREPPKADQAVKAFAPQLQPTKVPPADSSSKPRYNADPIPAAVLREVWQRDQGRCGYVGPATGRACGSTWFVQADHIVLRAHGGSNEASNLRLRCQAHSLLAAVDVLGEEKMAAACSNRGLRSR